MSSVFRCWSCITLVALVARWPTRSSRRPTRSSRRPTRSSRRPEVLSDSAPFKGPWIMEYHVLSWWLRLFLLWHLWIRHLSRWLRRWHHAPHLLRHHPHLNHAMALQGRGPNSPRGLRARHQGSWQQAIAWIEWKDWFWNEKRTYMTIVCCRTPWPLLLLLGTEFEQLGVWRWQFCWVVRLLSLDQTVGFREATVSS